MIGLLQNGGWAHIAVAVEPDQPEIIARAEALAAELNLPLAIQESARQQYALLLVVTQERLELRELADRPGRGLAIWADFVSGRLGHRLDTPGFGASMLCRAVGFKKPPWHVCDATAGLARDAFLLAAAGCEVTAIERSPIIAALVRDGLGRLALAPPMDSQEANVPAVDSQEAKVPPVCSRGAKGVRDRFRLIVADAKDWLGRLRVPGGDSPPVCSRGANGREDRPDVVYLDPMFPQRTKSALVKKEMRICRRVAGDDADAGELLDVARSVARSRVVVKRPAAAPPLKPDPAYRYKGRTIRYDVYLPAGGRE